MTQPTPIGEGGKPNPGTPKDSRLKTNKPKGGKTGGAKK